MLALSRHQRTPSTVAIVVILSVFIGCDSFRSTTVSSDSHRDNLVTKSNLIENELSRIGKPPKFRGTYVVGQQHFDYLRKLREIHFLDECKSLNAMVADVQNKDGTLPPQFFSNETWEIYENLLFMFCVSVHEGNDAETADALGAISKFLELQKNANGEENWNKLLAYRTTFQSLLLLLPEVPTDAMDVFHEQCKLIEFDMPCFWAAQIKSVVDLKEPNTEDEKKFLIAFLLHGQSLSPTDAMIYHSELVEKSNIIPMQDLQVPIPAWLRQLRVKSTNTDVLKRCYRFFTFLDSLESARAAGIVTKKLLDSPGQHRDLAKWSNEIYQTLAKEYPDAVVTFKTHPDNFRMCQILISLYNTGEDAAVCFPSPDGALDVLPISYGEPR